MAIDSSKNDQEDPGAIYAEEMKSMYGYEQHFGPISSVEAFISFDRFIGLHAKKLYVDGEVRCLADLVLAWLTYGEATLYCPTYEIFLKTIIEIIAVWNSEEDDVGMRSTLGNFPTREGGMNVGTVGREMVELSTITRPGSSVEMTTHPAFDRTAYEVARSVGQRTNWNPDRVHHRYDDNTWLHQP